MLAHALVTTQAPPQFHRIIGTYGGTAPGPLVICIGGIHGNEPAGVHALKRVMHQLNETRPPFQGEIVALSGNLNALNSECRFFSKDLNRQWTTAKIQAVKDTLRPDELDAEDHELLELLDELDKVIARRQGPVLVFDMHTTSADGAPFALISDTLENRRLSLALGVPLILGLEESIEGTILNYINELGFDAIGFEAGQHTAYTSVDNHEAAVWILLEAIGCLSKDDIKDYRQFQKRLKRAANGVPSVLELRYRHGITEEDQFMMWPGFTNFQPVRAGQILARDRKGLIYSSENCRLFMPLYQKQGNDGFFTVREIKPFWLKVSNTLRKANADRLLPWLPGVSAHPTQPETYVLDQRITRWYVIEICHLLGYRIHSEHTEHSLTVSRRKQADS